MSVIKGRGIVLNEIAVGESDKLVTLLVKELGKISASAKGARKSSGKLLAATQLFTYSEFVLYDGGKFYSIAQADVIENFFSIRNDYERYCFGCYFAEVCGKTIMDGTPCDEVLELLLRTLAELQRGRLENRLVSVVFTFKLLQILGFSPELTSCVSCQAGGRFGFFSSEGVLCGKCAAEAKLAGNHICAVSEAALYAVGYVCGSEFTKMFRFKVSPGVLDELTGASQIFMRSHLDISLKTRKYLDL